MNEDKTEKIELRIESDLKKRFDAICQEEAYNKSEILRRLLKKFILENS